MVLSTLHYVGISWYMHEQSDVLFAVEHLNNLNEYLIEETQAKQLSEQKPIKS